jgi:hypothetical protein
MVLDIQSGEMCGAIPIASPYDKYTRIVVSSLSLLLKSADDGILVSV